MAIRKARGTEVKKAPYQELYEGSRPSLHGLKPAALLPITSLDKWHEDDPIVIEPGTIVGLDSTGALVPASLSNHTTAAYVQQDVDAGIVSATGTGLNTGIIKPIGVCTAPVYSTVLETYTNYKRDLVPSVLSGNYSILVPVTNQDEHLIEAGDRVVAKAGRFASLSEEISALDTAAAALTAAELTLLSGDFVVGRCINKVVVAGTGETTEVKASAATDLTVTESRFSTLSRVQTVPGLGLTGADTQGLPAMVFQHGVTATTATGAAATQAAGDIVLLEIRIDL